MPDAEALDRSGAESQRYVDCNGAEVWKLNERLLSVSQPVALDVHKWVSIVDPAYCA